MKYKLIFTSASLLAIGFGIDFAIVLRYTGRPWKSAPPSTKIPQKWDILGNWQYSEAITQSVIFITFDADGTFRQVVNTGTLHNNVSSNASQSGRWTLDGNTLNVENALMYLDDNWKPYPWDGWKVQPDNSVPNKFIILGGPHPDPDDYQRLLRVRQ